MEQKKKTKTKTRTIIPSIPLQGIVPEKHIIWKDMCTSIFMQHYLQ